MLPIRPAATFAFALTATLAASGAHSQGLSTHPSLTDLFDQLLRASRHAAVLTPAPNSDLDRDSPGDADPPPYDIEFYPAFYETQEVLPMSRFLRDWACAANSDADSGCFRFGIEAVAVAAATSATPGCDYLRASGTLEVTEQNGIAGLQCPGCVGSAYTFSDWRQVLRVVYAGRGDLLPGPNTPCSEWAPPSPDAVYPPKACNSDLRHSLVNSWSHLFEAGCAGSQCARLHHAFRPDDVSGTTHTLLEMLGLPPLSSHPFCNGNEVTDGDPIRRPCMGNGFTNGEQVCNADNPPNPTTTSQGLGLVLPILIPQDVPFAGNAMCAPEAFGGASFGDVIMPFPAPTRCPNGATLKGGTCKWPRKSSGLDQSFACLAARNDRPGGTGSFDARVYNFIPRTGNGSLRTYHRKGSNPDGVNYPMAAAFYRIHQTRTISGSSLAPNTGCALADAHKQIGCLVEASPCSLGASSLSAVDGAVAGSPDPDRKLLGLGGQIGSAPLVLPTLDNVRLVLQPSGPACDGDAVRDGGFEDRYPLARAAWLCTTDGFGTGASGWETTGTQTPAELEAQSYLVQTVSSRSSVDPYLRSSGLVTLDDTGARPVEFISCASRGLPQ